jgi:hypothetical protein
MTAEIIPFAPRHPKPQSLETRLRVALERAGIIEPIVETVPLDRAQVAALRKFAVGFFKGHPDRNAER